MTTAAARATISELMGRELTDEERRHPWQILVDAVQRLDDLMVNGEFNDGAAYVEHVVLVVRMAKLVIDAGVAEKLALAQERHVEQEGQLMTGALVAAVNAVIDAVGMSPNAAVELRQRALGVAYATLAGQSVPEIPAIAPATAANAAPAADAYAQNMRMLAAESATGDASRPARATEQRDASDAVSGDLRPATGEHRLPASPSSEPSYARISALRDR